MISTWQKLTPEDSQREIVEDNTGKNQALPMNLPILAAHLDDTCAFYGEVFSSHSRDFYTVPPKILSEPTKALAEKMNKDTKSRKYYKELVSGLRSLIKYNLGGYAVRWEEGGGQGELAEPGNRIESIDMYNYLWDTTVLDPSKIPTEAEWAARATTKNRMWLERGQLNGRLENVEKVLYPDSNTLAERERAYPSNAPVVNGSMGRYYKQPPTYVGLSMDATDDHTAAGLSAPNWESYGLSLDSEGTTPIPGIEVVEMYCWLNPDQFGLMTPTQSGTPDPSQLGVDANGESYSLWRFTIVGSCEICKAEPVNGISGSQPEIPHYLGFMSVDDMKEAQRSVMELLKPFQRFSSFLFNIFVAGARKNIWGLKGYDPTMFDITKIKQGDVAGFLASMQPGRDVRTGLMTLDSSTGTDKTMEMLDGVMNVTQKLFPSQSLPSQVAGIDRAVKNQVAAVMQGAVRRLSMIAKIMDSDIMGPMRLQCYRNLSVNDSEGLQGLKEEDVAKVLGSGLNQLNRESVASEVKEMIYAVIQNPEASQTYDVAGLMNYWSQMMDAPSDLGEFVKTPPPAAAAGAIGPDGQPIAAPGVMDASGLAGGQPVQVPGI
jgi:hypothetical protein